MAILSWRISWMTTSRSVMLPRSTSGRAPSISSIIRFLIRGVSLKPPPSLCNILSLLYSPRALDLDDVLDLGHRAIQVVVEDHEVERPAALGHVDFAAGGAETL